ncbi:hypothetical protein [Arthrobacter sp. FB24]|uniref:hypothetical protein n=1 Tax=Arthrobacter sp. (strain FB24) TaxID=290399 RepID=UPI0000526C13|nr:hypothetical protein [Arthrobacter sp. FB24]
MDAAAFTAERPRNSIPLMAAAAHQREEPLAFISNREVFGDLVDSPVFVAAYLEAL